MRAVAIAALAPLALASGAGLVACLDLFHSTGDVLTACEIAPANAACATDASRADEVATDVCAWTPAEAHEHATAACAWLGACEGPGGRNQFGPCVFQASMAYDCRSNPNRRARGVALALWQCLLGVRSCDDVDRCVFPAGRPACSVATPAPVCGRSGATAGNRDVRVDCPGGDAAPTGENCALFGQTCAEDDAGSACAGDPEGFGCTQSECNGTASLRWCSSGSTLGSTLGSNRDIGIDCSSNGAQRCDVFPSRDAGLWASCVAESDAGAAAACTPTPMAACDGGVATSCPSGVRETLDCATLLGSQGACSAGALEPPFDWTSACNVSPAECQADSCDDAGGTLTGCARGAAFTVRCADAGLGPCRLLPGDGGGVSARAACTPPR